MDKHTCGIQRIRLETQAYTEALELEKNDWIWYMVVDSESKTPLLWISFEEYRWYAEKGEILEMKEIEKNVAVVLAEYMLLRRLFLVQIPSEYKISKTGIKKNWRHIIVQILLKHTEGQKNQTHFKNTMMNTDNAKYQLLAILKRPWKHHIKR